MGFESNFTGSENNSSAGATATDHASSLQAKIEGEKQAKIQELLAPYRVKRAELQAKRHELAQGLVDVDKALEELDAVISSTEASVGLHPSTPAKRKKRAGGKKPGSSRRDPVKQEWITAKLRERHLSSDELTKLAKQEKFKPASVRTVLTKMTDANLVRIADGQHYELVEPTEKTPVRPAPPSFTAAPGEPRSQQSRLEADGSQLALRGDATVS
jgi:hypothetical protein